MDTQDSLAKYKILVVEDNETYRKVITNALHIAGYGTLEAGDGIQGMELVKSARPDLVLLDIYMPIMDGLAMLKEIKKDTEFRKIPVIMLTNVQDELENSIKNGAEEAILKSSLTPHEVIGVCQKYLGQNS